MKRSLPLLLLLIAACSPPVQNELRIEPVVDENALTVTIETTFTLKPANDEVRDRVEAARTAALTNTDAWAARFSRVQADEEQTVVHKRQGVTDRVARSVRIRSDDLQQLLADANITVHAIEGEGWRELTFYPGTSARATREQQRQFESDLASWSRSVARYLTAMDHLYVYLRENPQREDAVFGSLLNKDGVELTEDELPLLEAAGRAMGEIVGLMDEPQEDVAARFAEEADLVFNAFPARVTVSVPGEVLESEGFAMKGREAVIEPIDVAGLIRGLEGKWLEPDPLAALLRDEELAIEQLLAVERRSTPGVSASEVATTIREGLARPKTFKVRWRM